MSPEAISKNHNSNSNPEPYHEFPNFLEHMEQIETTTEVRSKAEFVPTEEDSNVYHVVGELTEENVTEINNMKNVSTLILENTKGLSSNLLEQIHSDCVLFSVKGGLDYDNIKKYDTKDYKDRTMMSPEGLEKVVKYFERIESEMDPEWDDVQKCMYAYNCLAVDVDYGEGKDRIMSYGNCERGLNGLLYGELVCAGYAFAFNEMMARLGIECHYQNEKHKHAYNVVKLNNKFYGVDVTWDSYNKRNGECSFANFGRQEKEEFYSKNGHGQRDPEEKQYDLVELSDEEVTNAYQGISSKIGAHHAGVYHNFANQPRYIREKFLPVNKTVSEANRDAIGFVNMLQSLKKYDILTIDPELINSVQRRTGYILDVRERDIDREFSFGKKELEEYAWAERNHRLEGITPDQQKIDTIKTELNNKLADAIDEYLSRSFNSMDRTLELYEPISEDMDEMRKTKMVGLETKMDSILHSKNHLVELGFSPEEIEKTCQQIEEKLAYKNTNITPEEIRAKGIDFIGAIFQNKDDIRKDIANIEGKELSEATMQQKIHDANYLLNKIYPRLDLNEYGLTPDDFQKILDGEL